jgi:hypothetical protein
MASMLFVPLSVFSAAIVPFLVWVYNRRRNSFSILGQLRGPKSPSFWIGEHSLFFTVQYCTFFFCRNNALANAAP